MKSVPTEQVRTLAVIVAEGSLEAAARRLNLTPSAVSQRLRALESQVGRVLLVRSQPVVATAAAAPLLRFARQLEMIEREAVAAFDEDARSLRFPLAVNADSLATWMLPALAEAATRHPWSVEIFRADQEDTDGLLREGRVMAAVTTRTRPVPGCRLLPLGVMRYEAVASPSFIRRWFPDGVTADALTAAPVIDFDERDELQRRWLDDAGIAASDPPRHRIPAAAEFATATLLGMGWSLLPEQQSSVPLAEGRLLRLGGAPIDLALFWQQWDVRSAMLDELADIVVAHAQRALIRS